MSNFIYSWRYIFTDFADLISVNVSVCTMSGAMNRTLGANRPSPSCCEPHYESEAKCKQSFSFENQFCLHMNENKKSS